MKICRFSYKQSDGRCVLNGKKCDENCASIVEVSPPTHKDVLLKRWAQDTEAMARQTVWRHYWISKTCFIFPDGFQTDVLNIAVEHEAAYLNSAAEVGKVSTQNLMKIVDAIESEVVQSYLSGNIDELITECESVTETNCYWKIYEVSKLVKEHAIDLRDQMQEDTDEG